LIFGLLTEGKKRGGVRRRRTGGDERRGWKVRKDKMVEGEGLTS
jgi:hypothetical protein